MNEISLQNSMPQNNSILCTPSQNNCNMFTCNNMKSKEYTYCSIIPILWSTNLVNIYILNFKIICQGITNNGECAVINYSIDWIFIPNFLLYGIWVEKVCLLKSCFQIFDSNEVGKLCSWYGSNTNSSLPISYHRLFRNNRIQSIPWGRID